MPEVKWVDGWYDNADDVPKAFVTPHGSFEIAPIPMMPLGDIKKWLAANQRCNCPHSDLHSAQEYDRHHASWCRVVIVGHLLAQVQAWKEERYEQ